MNDYKSRVGTRSKEFSFQVTPERVAAFRGAVHAKDRGEVPPTFLTIAREGEFGLLSEFGLPLGKILHAEQGYEYSEPLKVGDEVLYVSELKQVLEKKGGFGAMTFFIFETEFTALRGGQRVRIGTARTNLLTRG